MSDGVSVYGYGAHWRIRARRAAYVVCNDDGDSAAAPTRRTMSGAGVTYRVTCCGLRRNCLVAGLDGSLTFASLTLGSPLNIEAAIFGTNE